MFELLARIACCSAAGTATGGSLFIVITVHSTQQQQQRFSIRSLHKPDRLLCTHITTVSVCFSLFHTATATVYSTTHQSALETLCECANSASNHGVKSHCSLAMMLLLLMLLLW
jgi:hypothetical protein